MTTDHQMAFICRTLSDMSVNQFYSSIFSHLLKEAVLLIGDGGGRFGEFAPLLPQTCPHVLLLEQGVKLCQGVQNLLWRSIDNCLNTW